MATSRTWTASSIGLCRTKRCTHSSNDLERPVGTYLYGRRMYEVMIVWETDHTLAARSHPMRDFAQIWQAADKIVYSKDERRFGNGMVHMRYGT
jgi:hypothetical protein